ncbi:MAG: HPr family phosphocarrier protein [Thermodesulfobacteriota bacterium]
MKVEQELAISNRLGLHVRPAGQLAAAAARFSARVWISCGDAEAEATSILDLLTLQCTCGKTVKLRAEGEEAAAAVACLAALITNRFDEE